MYYLLDSDVIIYHLRGKQQLNATWVKNNPSISVITLGELLYGARKSNKPSESIKLIKDLINDFNIEVIPLESNIISEYAKEKVLLERQGNKLDEFDLLIGITARVNNLKLATNNKKHFKRISDLKLI